MEAEMQVAKPKVMHFVHWTKSGITSIAKTLCLQEGHSLVLLNGDREFSSEYAGIDDAISLNADSNRFSWIWKLLNFLRSVKPDIVHCHSLMPFVIVCTLTLRSKIIFHIHSEYPYLSENDPKSRLKRLLIKLMTRLRKVTLISVSECSGRLMGKISGQRCFVLPNALPDHGSQRKPFTRAPSSRRFYSVCRLSEEKNLNLALNIIKRASEQSPQEGLSYDIYGEGPLSNDIRDMIGQLNLQDIVTMKGWCSTPDYLSANYDFYLSTSKFEGFSLSILSALRGKNIVITTNAGELVRNLSDGVSCFLIDSDAQKACETISKLLTLSDDHLDSIQEAGRSVYLSKYGYDHFTHQLHEIYANAV